MQGWQNLLTQISIGVLVNAIIGILCWLIKREFLFFKGKMLIPRPPKIFKNKSNYYPQRPLNAAYSLPAVSIKPSFLFSSKKMQVCENVVKAPQIKDFSLVLG